MRLVLSNGGSIACCMGIVRFHVEFVIRLPCGVFYCDTCPNNKFACYVKCCVLWL